MNFKKSEADENYQIARWVSENNVWEIGLNPVIFGIRVVGGRVGSGCYSINYCAANDKMFALQVLVTVFRIMVLLPESTTARELEDLLPKYDVKPINLDPCWENLQELAAKLEETNTCSDADKVFVSTQE
jgi:hypothetical protein